MRFNLLSNTPIPITKPTVLIPPNNIDIGLTARPNRNGFVAVDLGMGADPETFTSALVASERAGMPSWRFRKEYLRDWEAQSGQPVFEAEWLDWQRLREREPLYCLDVRDQCDLEGEVMRRDDGQPIRELHKTPRGRIRVFVDPSDSPASLPAGIAGGRRSFAMGIDVSEGVGSSDSTIVVMASDTKEQAAAFNCNRTHPGELGRIAALLARYYGDALVCPVRKMHGITTIRAMVDDGYTRIWRHAAAGRLVELESSELGWKKGESSDELLFGRWGDALQNDWCKLHDMETVRQHTQYIYDELGRIVFQSLSSLPLEARARHGDLVVAAALAYRACLDLGLYRMLQPYEAPEGSLAARRAARKARRRKAQLQEW